MKIDFIRTGNIKNKKLKVHLITKPCEDTRKGDRIFIMSLAILSGKKKIRAVVPSVVACDNDNYSIAPFLFDIDGKSANDLKEIANDYIDNLFENFTNCKLTNMVRLTIA